MTMEEMGFGGYGFLILIILFIWMIFGGGLGGCNRNGCNGGCNAVTTCQAEKQEIIDSARTQYMIENTSRITQEQTMSGLAALGTKIDYYAYQDLRDQLAQERTKNVVLENRVYSDGQFNALRAQIEAIGCGMLKQPPVYGVGTSCNAIYATSPFVTNGCGC